MDAGAHFSRDLWPLAVYIFVVIALVAFMLGLSALLGERRRERATGEPYESGIVSTGSARLRFDAKFYLMAMFFVIFDLEAAFVYAYAIAFRELGWIGYMEILAFIGILMGALFYVWRLGALEWGTSRSRMRKQPGRNNTKGFGSCGR
jgi:NADH-quinone oxidoreductase subunit A